VNPAGGPGVEHSIGAAIARVADGDTIIVHSGTYNEDVRVDKRLTPKGLCTGGGRPVVDGGGLDYPFDITITASNVTLQGFGVRNGDLGIVINSQFNPSVAGITVFDNWISGTNGNSITVDFSNGNNITGNTLSMSVRGIVVDTQNNVIYGNMISAMSERGIGVSFTGNSNLIAGNLVHDCRGDGIEIGGSLNHVNDNIIRNCTTGIFITKSGNDVENNSVYGNDEGLCPQVADGNWISGNLACANSCGLRLVQSRNNSITNNTFRDNPGGAIYGDATLGFNNFSSNTDATLPPLRHYEEGSPYIEPSTPAGGDTVYVGGPEG
jgi:nitrous oxidase accessory protein